MDKEFKKPSGYKNVNTTQFIRPTKFNNSYSCIDYVINKFNCLLIQPFCK